MASSRQKLDISVLEAQVDDVVLGKGNPRIIGSCIKKRLRFARLRGDDPSVEQLRLLFGRLFLNIGQANRAGKQFRLVLREHPTSIEALIGLADSYAVGRRFSRSKQWLESALVLVVRKNDHRNHLAVLDRLAWQALAMGDSQGLTKSMAQGCDVLDQALKMDNVQMSSVVLLLEMGKGRITVDYLECLVRHVLRRGYSSGTQNVVVRLLAQAYGQMGLTSEDSLDRLEAFGSLADSLSTRKAYDEAMSRAIRVDAYPMVGNGLYPFSTALPGGGK